MKNCSAYSHATGSHSTGRQAGGIHARLAVYRQHRTAGSRCTTPHAPLCSPHSLRQLPFLRDPWTFSCSRTHLEPGHSASPGPALSCGKICSWTQNHIVLEQKPRSSVRAAQTRSSLVNVHANPRSITRACQTHRPKPFTPSKTNRHTRALQNSLGLAHGGAAGAQTIISTSEELTCLQKLPTRLLCLLLLQDSGSI